MKTAAPLELFAPNADTSKLKYIFKIEMTHETEHLSIQRTNSSVDEELCHTEADATFPAHATLEKEAAILTER